MRQLQKANRDFSMAAPELIREMLDQFNALMQAQWPLTQHRQIKLPDGTMQVLEPDPKATQLVLQIMKDKAKLLGLESTTVNLNIEEPMKSSLAGAEKPVELSTHSPESVSRELVEIMVKSGILPEQFLQTTTLQLESGLPSLAEIEEDLKDIEEHDEVT